MALPVTKQKPLGIPIPGQKSYAAAARPRFPTKPHSLMHGEAVTESSGKPTTPATHLTARTNGGYFLDISKIPNTTVQQHLQALDQQYKASNFIGIKFLGKANQRYMEIYPNTDIFQRFLAEGVMYASENSKTQLLLCKAVDGDGKLI